MLVDILLLHGGIVNRFIEWVLGNGGLFLLLFIVFAETGLFVGFFLPGDSLLFVAGIYSANLANDFFRKIGMGGVHNEALDLFVLVALISLAGILGNTVGYWTGKKIG